MRAGREIRPNGVVIRVIATQRGKNFYRVEGDPRREVWGYVHNARKYADSLTPGRTLACA